METAFAELAATLHGEVNTLGSPKAALLGFCVALVAYNVLSTLQGALRSVHGEVVVAEDVSGYDVADEIKRVHDGMMIAIPEDEWVVFHDLTAVELAGVLVQLAAAVRLPKYQKHPRGPKKPRPKRFGSWAQISDFPIDFRRSSKTILSAMHPDPEEFMR